MVVHGTTEVDLWPNQFDREDLNDAKRLLSAIRNVTAEEFRYSMTNLIRSQVEAEPAPVGLFVESERRNWRGRPHRLFSEKRRKHRRAFGSGPPIISPTRTVDPEVGSEGVIAQIVTEVSRQARTRATIHPGPKTIRERKIRRFILVTDFIGSGDRAYRYLDSAWRVRSVRSWWSARRSKDMSFEVIAYSATEVGRVKIEAHPTRPVVNVVEGCPTIKQVFDLPEVRLRMKDLCIRYGSFISNFDPLGFGGTGALITFAHGMPNNAPAIFHKRSKLKTKPWAPLYPERVTSDRRTNIVAFTEDREASQLELHQVAKEKVLLSPSFLTAPSVIRDAVHVLLSLDRAPRTETAISIRTGLSVMCVRDALARSRRYGWVDDDSRITDKGRKELARLGASVQREVEFKVCKLLYSALAEGAASRLDDAGLYEPVPTAGAFSVSAGGNGLLLLFVGAVAWRQLCHARRCLRQPQRGLARRAWHSTLTSVKVDEFVAPSALP